MKNNNFHIKVLGEMTFVAILTIVSMIFTHYFVQYTLSPDQKASSFTSQKSQFPSDDR
jgi:preprotein translocase subunit SecY